MKKFEKLVQEIGQSFTVNVSKLIEAKELRVYRLGQYYMPQKGTFVNLSEYYADEEGDLYTLNNDTWFTKHGVYLKQLSNGSSNGGSVINTLRDTSGIKVTLRRNYIKRMVLKGAYERVSFDELPIVQGKVETKNFSSNIA